MVLEHRLKIGQRRVLQGRRLAGYVHTLVGWHFLLRTLTSGG